MSLWSRSFFLRRITADPSPWGNFTPPTKQECGETLGDLEPVYDLLTITNKFIIQEAVTQTSGLFLQPANFLTVNPRGPLPLREIRFIGETIERRDPGGSWAHLRLRVITSCQRVWHWWPTRELISRPRPDNHHVASKTPCSRKTHKSEHVVYPNCPVMINLQNRSRS